MIDVSELRPPEASGPAELEWTLTAAFARNPRPFPGDLDAAAALDLAQKLNLSERIGVRISAHQLADDSGGELPAELRDTFRMALARSAAISLLYEETAREVAQTAISLESPLVFLKGLALSLAGLTAPGSRAFNDIDILVPERLAESFFAELSSAGYTPSPAEATEQHLPELRPPRGGSLEIHFALRGIQDRDGSPVTFAELNDHDALVPCPSFPGECFTPEPKLLAAHALVHGFQQHLLRPQTYPLFRMVGDLLDLLPNDDAWSDLEHAWHPAIEHSVSAQNFDAVRSLCASLSAGRLPATASDESLLLRHIIAGCLDPEYGESLAKTYRRKRLAEAKRRGELGAYLKRKLRPLFGRKRLSRG